ncbi:hypothetical protein KJZ99_11265 [bacterium]|nr:hypothetical protein [bacterium]
MRENDSYSLPCLLVVRLPIGSFPINLRAATRSFCFHYLKEALAMHNGNISKTAKSLGISRRNLQLKLKQLGIKREDIQPRPRLHLISARETD